MPGAVTCAVEGIVDEAVVRRLVDHVGGQTLAVYGPKGKQALRKTIAAYNNAARISPWLVVVDLDHDADCPADLRDLWLPTRADRMCFRVAVRAIESWLLADRERAAQYLHVSPAMIPRDPDSLPNPKEQIVNLARRSRSRDIREGLVPRVEGGRTVGPGYAGQLIQLAQERWRPDVAAKVSPSLNRTMIRLRELLAASR